MPAHTAASPYERRTFPMLELKALDDAAGTFSGYLAVFGNEDQGGDIIQPGAFAKSLADLQTKQRSRDSRYILPIFWSHMPEEPLGGFVQASEDSHGLFVKGELDLDIEQGRRAYSGLKRGYLSGMSIGYITVKQAYEGNARVLKELRLLEGSLTAIPMNEEAQVVTVKDNQGATESAAPVTRKARDFDTLFQSLNAADDLQDEWGDTFIAFTHAMSELMYQAQAQTNGWLSPDMPKIDAQEATQANLDAFGKAVLDLVARSVAASFAPCLDNDGDQFLDPDGCNADDDDDDAPGYMSDGRPRQMKAGRVMSASNHEAMGKALDTMKTGLDAVKAQHKALTDMHAQMSPNAKPASDDEPSANDTQDAAGDTGKGGKSAERPGAGAGAASGGNANDALDRAATLSATTEDDEENAQRLAMKISANLLAMRMRKGAA